jgi:4-aminobutyrate aminotransferase
MPIGGFIARESVWTWPAGAHGSTFAGNPVCAAAALATIQLIEDGLLDNAAALGPRLHAGLRRVSEEHGHVRDVRGIGLMQAVEFSSHEAANAVEQEAFERGLLVLECGEASLRLCPPLMVDEDVIDRAIAIFGEALAAAARPEPGLQETGG